MGRLVVENSDIRSGELGDKGRLDWFGSECGARSDRDGSAVLKSGEIRAEAEGCFEDRTSAWRASGKIWV